MKPNLKTPPLHLPLHLPTAHKEATKLRLAYHANGYRVLPTAEKVAFQKGWPTMNVDEKAIRSWPMTIVREGTLPAVTTAIQLIGTMLAIDVDVQDDDVSRQIEDLVIGVLDPEMKMPMRTSGSAKFMVMCQTDKPFAMWKTPKYIDGDGNDHMVEVYGGASTRYFSCAGPHTLGDLVGGRYEVQKAYEWVKGPTPLDTRPEDLPLITQERLNIFLMQAADVLANQGWEKIQGTTSGHAEGGVVYDLTEDMTFETKDGPMSYWEAVSYAVCERDARCSSSFHDGTSKNTAKCRMRVLGSDDDLSLSVFNHEEWRTHLPASHAPKTAEERMEAGAALGAKLRELDLSEYEQEEPVSHEFRETVEMLMRQYVFCEKSNAYHSFGGDPFSRILGAAIKQTYNMRLHYRKIAGNGQTYDKVTTAGEVFMAQEEKMKAWFPEYDPRKEPGTLFFSDFTGKVVMNAWNGFPDLGEADPHWVDLIEHDFLPHLMPDPNERDFVLDWLATKWARPWERMSAILFLAEIVSGTGRGTLFEILDGVFGTNAQLLTEHQLFNDQFNAWSVSNVLIMCNELGKSSRWENKEETYGRMKELIDPTNTQTSVRHMGVASAKAQTFTSFIMATNRGDGVRLDYEDRRIAVIRNGEKLTRAGTWADEMMGEKRSNGVRKNLAPAMAAILRDREIKSPASVLDTPPKFAGWYSMVEKASGAIDRVLREIGEEHFGKEVIWTKKAFKHLVWEKAKGEVPKSATVTTVQREIEQLVGEKAEQLGLHFMKAKVKPGLGQIEIVTTFAGTEKLPPAVEDRETLLIEGGASMLAAALRKRGETA